MGNQCQKHISLTISEFYANSAQLTDDSSVMCFRISQKPSGQLVTSHFQYEKLMTISVTFVKLWWNGSHYTRDKRPLLIMNEVKLYIFMTLHKACDMAQVVSCWPLTTHAQVSPCEIYHVQSGTGTSLSPSSPVFPSKSFHWRSKLIYHLRHEQYAGWRHSSESLTTSTWMSLMWSHKTLTRFCFLFFFSSSLLRSSWTLTSLFWCLT
jgi:hypothetical protein